MYKPSTEPIKCPKCGAIVKVTAIRFPDIEWKCLMCGESGSIKQGATSGYIQKVSEPNPGVGVTTTNATGDGYNTINAVPSIYSPMTECEICGEEFKFDSRSYICPKCREAVVKLRGTADSTANTMPENKSAVTAHQINTIVRFAAHQNTAEQTGLGQTHLHLDSIRTRIQVQQFQR